MPLLTNFRGLTLISVIETFLAVKVLPSQLIPQSAPLSRVALAIFGVNYSILFVYSFFIYPRFISPLRKFPRPKRVLHRMMRARLAAVTAPGQVFVDLAEEIPNDGIIGLGAFGQTRLLLTKPAPLADILVHHPYDFVKPLKVRNFLRRILGDGLIIVEGDRHRFLRKNSLPAFSFRHIKDLYPMMWSKSLNFIEYLDQDIKQQLHDQASSGGDLEKEGSGAGKAEMNRWANKIALDVIGIAGLGRDFNVLKNSDDPLAQNYEALLEPSREKFLFFFAATWVSWRLVRILPWKLNKMFIARTSSLKEICNDLVRAKREAILLKKGDDHFDILSLLIKSDNFSDEELSDQLLTYLAAGHETTSSAFTWTCYLLATHPKIQSILRAEVRQAFPLTADAIPLPNTDIAGTMERLPYLNGIANETLRLFPTVPVTIRVAQYDTHICQHAVPKGTEILLSPWQINRSKDLWGPDADEFRPERWIDDGRPNNMGGATSNYDYLTFLHGPRSCIGQGFAKAELRCLIAAMVRKFEWELDMNVKDVIPGGAITIKPTRGLHLKVKVAPE